MLSRTRYLARMGEAFWMAGRCVEGLAAIAEALALVERTGERVSEAEIWRVKGDLLLKTAAGDAMRKRRAAIKRPSKSPAGRARNRGNSAPQIAWRACGNGRANTKRRGRCWRRLSAGLPKDFTPRI